MQLTDTTKKILLALLSCCFILLLMWNNNNALISTVSLYNARSEFFTSESVWTTLASEFTLVDKEQNAEVRKEVRKLLADPKKLYEILKTATPYIHFIHEETRLRNLPAELALIPFIESEFNPNDRSNKGALGLWQLMKGTAHILGVKIKAGNDERRNVVVSTKAALTYFADLGAYFNGNWYLAIAAYNCGQGKVKSAVRRAKSENFWDLKKLPRETKEYLPKLLAIAEIVQHPEKYGFELPQV